MWDAQTGQELLSLKGFAGRGPALAFSPDGKRLASSQSPALRGPADPGEIKVWDAQTGQELLTLKGHIAASGASSSARTANAWPARAVDQRR